jgi:hypothetical protein
MQIDPQYFLCYEEVERKDYNDFGLTAEMRFGYKFDFKSEFFINLQFFGGYHIINPKPDSFKEVDGSSLYLSPIPMFFLGYKF